jgi:hypothetical protein
MYVVVPTEIPKVNSVSQHMTQALQITMLAISARAAGRVVGDGCGGLCSWFG